jgi:hypothetical protein
VIFKFNGILLRAAQYQQSVPISAVTFDSALTELTAGFPQLKRLLLDNSGQLRQAHRVILNGELIPRPTSALSLAEEDQVEFFTAIAGG